MDGFHLNACWGYSPSPKITPVAWLRFAENRGHGHLVTGKKQVKRKRSGKQTAKVHRENTEKITTMFATELDENRSCDIATATAEPAGNRSDALLN